jgi:hypothetical protein
VNAEEATGLKELMPIEFDFSKYFHEMACYED